MRPDARQRNVPSGAGIAQYRLGRFEKDRFTEALATLSRCDSNHPTTLLFLAMTRWQLGDKDKARADLVKAVESLDKEQPSDPDMLQFRAEAAQQMADREP